MADITPDATHAYGVEPDQVLEVFAPATPNGHTVVVVHGGFWRPRHDRAHARPQARALADLGYRCLLPEYRRVPGSPDLAVDDLLAAIAHAGADHPILVGHSAGGQLALIAGLRSAPAAVVSLGGVVDLGRADELGLGTGAVRDFLGCAAAGRPDLDPARCPRPSHAVHLVHGTDDEDVPVELSTRLAAAWGCGLTILPATGHMELIDPHSRAWAEVTAVIASMA